MLKSVVSTFVILVHSLFKQSRLLTCRIKLDVIQSETHRELSLRAALESVVLMKNDDLRGLPLKASVQNVCVIGPFIDDNEVLFGDYSPTIMVCIR